MIKSFRLYGTIIILMLCISCRNTSQTSLIYKSDTAEAMQILFDSTISLPRLADLNRLLLNNPFRDSALVVKDSFAFKYLPKNYKLKFLSIDSIRNLAKRYGDSTEFPNYLEFGFKKLTDSTFEAYVQNFQTENNKSFISALNNGCFKYMTFKRTNQGIISKVEKTLYD